ncbi:MULTISPECIES: hypothetical protein [Tsukamurella]|uniref:Uncharacterized protein n=2 Tax=Tsukamurella TaxID=2060 RepID=A0A5C5RXV3_9ACTN|nr:MULTISPECIES: hypothetical protein [Tsukamurella]NMD55576.1 hypothetical protein [Tsukamurella columbiensis]TWS27318.1 hypothetical protein FK530_19435 [Tsukamurella conjunctivitidis]
MTTTPEISSAADSQLHDALDALMPQPYNLTQEQIATIRAQVTTWLDDACARLTRELRIERDGVKVAHFGDGMVHILIDDTHEIYGVPVQTLRTLVEVGGEILAMLDKSTQ